MILISGQILNFLSTNGARNTRRIFGFTSKIGVSTSRIYLERRLYSMSGRTFCSKLRTTRVNKINDSEIVAPNFDIVNDNNIHVTINTTRRHKR